MDALLQLHSIVRWVVIITAVAALIRHLSVWKGGNAGGKVGEMVASLFPRLMDVQMLFGIVLLVWLGVAGYGFTTSRVLHSIVMAGAVICSHIPQMRKHADAKASARLSLLTVAISLLLVTGGVWILSM